MLHKLKYLERLIGIDLSKESLVFAKKFVQSKNLELKQGNNLKIPLETVDDLQKRDDNIYRVIFEASSS